MTHYSTLKQNLLYATPQDVFLAAESLLRTQGGRKAVEKVLREMTNAYKHWQGASNSWTILQHTPRPDPCPPEPPALLPRVGILAGGPDLAVYAHNDSLWVRIPDFRALQPDTRVEPLNAGVAAAVAGALGARLEAKQYCYPHVADLRKQKKWVVKDPQTGLRHTFLKAEHAHKRATEYQVKLALDLPFAQITIPVEEVLE